MSFNTAAALLSVGIGMLLALLTLIRADGKFVKESDIETLLLGGFLIVCFFAVCAYCLIAGDHWLIKTW